jgi:hypothetical protein
MASDIGDVFRAADEAGLRLQIAAASVDAVHGDAVLFDAVQVPVVALAVVACIARRRGGESVNVLGARVGHALMSAFPAFGRVGRYLQWSIRVRTVTVDALTFLEGSDIITVSADPERKAALTDIGRKFVSKIRSANEDATNLYKALAMAVDRTRTAELRLL